MDPFIPESWQPLIAQWAVYVLGALAVTSALVHVLAPIARRVQRWTLTTSATWDDGPARWVADRLEWLSGALAVVLPMLPHVTALRDERPAKRREPIIKRPPSGGALALVLVVVAAALHATGCGGPPEAVRRGTTAAAMGLAAMDAPAAEGYRHAHEEALASSPSAESYALAMGPWNTFEEAMRGSGAALLALDAAFDAWSEGGAGRWIPLAACAGVALAELADAADVVHLRLDPEITAVITPIRALAGSVCPERE